MLGLEHSAQISQYNTTVGEFSARKDNLDSSRGNSTGIIVQTLDVENNRISYEIVCPEYIHDSDKISVFATVFFTESRFGPVITSGLLLPEDIAKNIQWSSSDSNVVYISNGQAKVKSCGSATISAEFPDGNVIKKSVSVQHDYEVTVTEATCKDEGKIVKKCTICGDTVIQTIPKTNRHAYETTTTEATCKDEGEIVKKCTICDDTVIQTIPKTNKHTYETTTTEATCKDEGMVVKKCRVCGDTVTQTIPKTENHIFGSWVITKEPTADEDGTESRTCTVCGTVEARTMKYEPTETDEHPTPTEGGSTETTAEPTPDSSGAQSTESAGTPSDTDSQEVINTDAPNGDTQSSDKDTSDDNPDTTASASASSGSYPSDMWSIWIPIAIASSIVFVIGGIVLYIYIKRKKR